MKVVYEGDYYAFSEHLDNANGGLKMDETASIEEIKKKYHEEWVLVEVLEEDELDHVTKGKLLAHSKSKNKIYEAMKKYKGYTYLFFAGEIPKKGYAFAF